MIKYIVFDFDGTLVDSKAIFVRLYNEIAKKHGYKLMTPDSIEYLRSLSIPQRCTYLEVPLYKIPFMAAKVINGYKAAIPHLQFNQGVEEMLKDLSDMKIPVAVLSSNSKGNITEFLRLKNIDVTDVYCSSNIFGKDKLLSKFLSSKKLAPSEILYVGDEARDIIACNKLGIQIAWVGWGYDTDDAIKELKPAFKANEPSALLQFISGFSSP